MITPRPRPVFLLRTTNDFALKTASVLLVAGVTCGGIGCSPASPRTACPYPRPRPPGFISPSPNCAAPAGERSSNGLARPPLFERVCEDHLQFYGADSLLLLGGGLAVGGAIAHSDADRRLHDDFRSGVGAETDGESGEMLHGCKELGDGRYLLPTFAAAWATSALVDGPPALATTGCWGERSLRAVAVGAPPLLALQQITGGSRPGETSDGSAWSPLKDDNGVSGHSFMSSVPFLTAGHLTRDPWIKAAWYAGSAVGPLSRVADGAHYPSQAFLGWGLALLATRAVADVERRSPAWRLAPRSPSGGHGLSLERRW